MSDERILDNGNRPSTPGKVEKAVDALATGGFSLLRAIELPSEDELAEIEAKGFDLESVQACIDRIQGLSPDGMRVAATLRGALNDLLARGEEAQTVATQ